VIDKTTGDIYGLSDNPLSPQGFNQYAGTLGVAGFAKTYRPVKGEVKRKFKELPADVQTAIVRRFKEE
jgi:hypothetical protein